MTAGSILEDKNLWHKVQSNGCSQGHVDIDDNLLLFITFLEYQTLFLSEERDWEKLKFWLAFKS